MLRREDEQLDAESDDDEERGLDARVPREQPDGRGHDDDRDADRATEPGEGAREPLRPGGHGTRNPVGHVGVQLAQSSGVDNVGGDGREREKRGDQDEEQQLGRDAEPLQTRHVPAGEPWYIRLPAHPQGGGMAPWSHRIERIVTYLCRHCAPFVIASRGPSVRLHRGSTHGHRFRGAARDDEELI